MTKANPLGEAVLARRDERDWTQLDVWNRGGPSNSTLTAIESGANLNPPRATLRKLDVGLDWTPGSARSVLAGGEPTPLEEVPHPHPRATREPVPSVDELTRRAQQLREPYRGEAMRYIEYLEQQQRDERARADRPSTSTGEQTA